MLDSYLPSNGNNEGLGIPEVRDLINQNQIQNLNWSEVKNYWDEYLRRSRSKIFIESSPKKLSYMDQIFQVFDANKSISVILVSNPYLQIASSIKNYHSILNGEIISQVSNSWILKMRKLYKLKSDFPQLPAIKYEDFCQNPKLIIFAIKRNLPNEFYRPLNNDSEIKLKGKKTSGYISQIIDMTARHLAFFKWDEVVAINQILSQAPKIMKYFQYSLITEEKQYKHIIDASPDLEKIGLEERKKFDHRY